MTFTGCLNVESAPPILVASSFDDRAPWLHDRLWFDFDDFIEYSSWEAHAQVELEDGTVLPVLHGWSVDDASRVSLTVEAAAIVSGTIFVRLDGVTDTSGNEVDTTSIEWRLDEWTVEDIAQVPGLPGPPILETIVDPWGHSMPLVVAAWTTGPMEDRELTGVFRGDDGWMDAGTALTYGDAIDIEGAAYGDHLYVVGDIPGIATWSQSWGYDWDLPYTTHIASSPNRTQLALMTWNDGQAVELHQPGLQPLVLPNIPTDGYADPVDVALPSDGEPVVGFLVRESLQEHRLGIAWYEASGWRTSPPRLVPSEPSRLELVVSDGSPYVMWTDPDGDHFARVNGDEIVELPLPSSSAMSRLTVDGNGSMIAAWVENRTIGRIGRWNGIAWEEIAAPWAEEVSTIDASAVVMWSARIPVVAWRQGGEVRIALYNGAP